MTPRRFPYLTDVANRYGDDHVRVSTEKQRICDALSADDIKALANAYSEIERRDDVAALSRYVTQERDLEARQLLMLLFLFGDLADRQVDPFVSRTVRIVEEHKPLDWNKLPVELRYLAAPAEKYGKYQFQHDVDRFLDQITTEQEAELREIAQRVEVDNQKVEDFISAHDMTQHGEAELVYFMLFVIAEYKDRGGCE